MGGFVVSWLTRAAFTRGLRASCRGRALEGAVRRFCWLDIPSLVCYNGIMTGEACRTTGPTWSRNGDTMSIHDDQPFHYKGGDFIEKITVTYRSANADGAENRRPYLIGLAGIEQVSLQPEHAERLLMDLFDALYQHDGISMDNAGIMHTMCLTILQDPREALEAAMMEAGEDL